MNVKLFRCDALISHKLGNVTAKDYESLELTSITHVAHRSTKSQVFTLKFGSQKIPVYCHMGNFGCGDGGWTLAMKIDGTKVCNCLLSFTYYW